MMAARKITLEIPDDVAGEFVTDPAKWLEAVRANDLFTSSSDRDTLTVTISHDGRDTHYQVGR